MTVILISLVMNQLQIVLFYLTLVALLRGYYCDDGVSANFVLFFIFNIYTTFFVTGTRLQRHTVTKTKHLLDWTDEYSLCARHLLLRCL